MQNYQLYSFNFFAYRDSEKLNFGSAQTLPFRNQYDFNRELHYLSLINTILIVNKPRPLIYTVLTVNTPFLFRNMILIVNTTFP